MSKKNITKSDKVAYIVDITRCNNVKEVALEMAIAKQEAGVPLNCNDVAIICDKAIDDYTDILNEVGVINKKDGIIFPADVECVCEKPKKKGNIFKRFWNWLLGRK